MHQSAELLQPLRTKPRCSLGVIRTHSGSLGEVSKELQGPLIQAPHLFDHKGYEDKVPLVYQNCELQQNTPRLDVYEDSAARALAESRKRLAWRLSEISHAILLWMQVLICCCHCVRKWLAA